MSWTIPDITLNSGNKIPILAFGTAAPFFGTDCSQYISQALRAGIRHFDTAQLYSNQESVGKALHQWEGNRQDVYITAKWGLEGDVENDPKSALEETLRLMETDYVDMFLMHSPITLSSLSMKKAWAMMEQLKDQGKCKDIGVSNFGSLDIKRLSEAWKVVPAMNQIEYSPYNSHDSRSIAAVQICKDHGIAISGFGCLQPLSLKNEPHPLLSVLAEVSERLNLNEGQILLKWAQQSIGGPVVT
nr:uncharacterized protein I206_00296 [Kwoniella pini CBS 10737]OCF52995.1 hypothetical protein I206_00296 [Kwoniella pini CBS 10737]